MNSESSLSNRMPFNEWTQVNLSARDQKPNKYLSQTQFFHVPAIPSPRNK